jgi:hypothetical protein
MLCYATLWDYAMGLYNAMLCYVIMLCCAMWGTMLRYAVLCCELCGVCVSFCFYVY